MTAELIVPLTMSEAAKHSLCKPADESSTDNEAEDEEMARLFAADRANDQDLAQQRRSKTL
eukprot:SAG31_NODE_23_length_33717_cov_17.863585_22_plen_61_part_00